ncbi:MAG: hypothetical protein V9F03_02015 [Microthrixaceae bacterium]
MKTLVQLFTLPVRQRKSFNMKKLILSCLILSTTSAIAGDLRTFTGKYEPVNCPIDDVSRVYIQVQGNERYRDLVIHYYGDDAKLDSFDIMPGKHIFPGTEPSIHGKITEENVLNFVTPTHLKIQTEVNNKGVIKRGTSLDLKLKGDILTIDGGIWLENGDESGIVKKVRN